MSKLVIIGASGHGKVLADIAKKNGYLDIIFLDDDSTLQNCMKYLVQGETKTADQYIDADFVVAIGNAKIRERIQKELQEKKIRIVTLIHPNAVVADGVEIGAGTVVMAGAVINSDTVIGEGCIINTAASVDHDNRIGDYTHISVGSHLAGKVILGKRVWVGIGAVVSNNLSIVDDCVIGAGATVVKNLEERGTYIGTPARLKK